MTLADPVVWHDVECGSYSADLPLWRDLAGDPTSTPPILDLGAGTGRVSLDLAQAGHQVHALDVDAGLLAALRERAAQLPGVRVQTHVADARDFDLGDVRFGLILAPMQTVQLLGGAEARGSMLAAVRRHLAPGGRFAAALANTVEGFEEGDVVATVPDMREIDGVVYASLPTAMRHEPGGFLLLRVREKVGPDGARGQRRRDPPRPRAARDVRGRGPRPRLPRPERRADRRDRRPRRLRGGGARCLRCGSARSIPR
jgi:SAM-dependent methyltransferase